MPVNAVARGGVNVERSQPRLVLTVVRARLQADGRAKVSSAEEFVLITYCP
jgi:hypothetical protein